MQDDRVSEKDGVKKYDMLPGLRACPHHRARLTLYLPALQGLQPTVSGETIFRFTG
jgi:hypothetical protein